MKKIIFVAITIFSIGCFSSKKTAKSVSLTQKDADRAAVKFPGATLASLEEGQTFYKAHCGKCHGLKDANAYTEEQWNKIIPPMAKKAKIDEKTQQSITQYLLTMCSAK